MLIASKTAVNRSALAMQVLAYARTYADDTFPYRRAVGVSLSISGCPRCSGFVATALCLSSVAKFIAAGPHRLPAKVRAALVSLCAELASDLASPSIR